MNNAREHALQLLNHLAPEQVAAVVHLMEVMLHPVSRKFAGASPEDEEISQDEEQAVSRSKEWFKHNEGIPFEQVVADLGLTMDHIHEHKDPA